jgi:hypothetical protein
MVIFKENLSFNVGELSEIIRFINIKRLNIFCVNNELDNETVYYVRANRGSDLRYAELNLERFKGFLNSDKNFWDYNKDSLYIVRNGNYLDIKNIFATVNGTPYNIGRGGSQRSHGLSPLDLRLSYYIMAMFKFDSELISRLNYFNEMPKDRYLSYKDMSKKKVYKSNL